MHVNLGEDLGIDLRALRTELHFAARNALSALAEDDHDVVRGATAGAGEHGLHRPRAQIASTALGCAVHHEGMAALRFGDEAHALSANPLHPAFHCKLPKRMTLRNISTRHTAVDAPHQIILAPHKTHYIMSPCWARSAQSPPPSSFGGFKRGLKAALFFA